MNGPFSIVMLVNVSLPGGRFQKMLVCTHPSRSPATAQGCVAFCYSDCRGHCSFVEVDTWRKPPWIPKNRDLINTWRSNMIYCSYQKWGVGLQGWGLTSNSSWCYLERGWFVQDRRRNRGEMSIYQLSGCDQTVLDPYLFDIPSGNQTWQWNIFHL